MIFVSVQKILSWISRKIGLMMMMQAFRPQL